MFIHKPNSTTFISIFLILFLFSSTASSQNLLRNPSFEKKSNAKFTYGLADKTLAEWTCIKFVGLALFHPSDAHYVDTCLFKRFKEEGFPISPAVRLMIVKPHSGTCYIKGNSFHRVLFHQNLTKEINKEENYIIQFQYRIHSLSNEYDKISSAHFGVSLFNKPIDLKYMRSPKYAKELSMRYRNYVFINEFDSLSKNDWVKFQATIQSSKVLSELYLGGHTDFATSIIPRKGTHGGVRGNYQGSFVFFVDQVQLISLSNFLSGSFSELKNQSFSIPIAYTVSEKDLWRNSYLKQIVNQLKKNTYESMTIAIENIKEEEQKAEFIQLIKEYLIQNGIKQETIFSLKEIKSNLITSKDLSPKGAQLKIRIQ